MNWGRVFFVFFSVLSLTLSVAFLYEMSVIILFLSTSVNFLCATLRIGVKSALSEEVLATLLVAILQLIVAFVILQVFDNLHLSYALTLGAVVANAFGLVLLVIESIKDSQEDLI